MGSIVAFNPRRKASAPRKADKAAGTIVIFPGVRYERTLPGKDTDLNWTAAGWMATFHPKQQSQPQL